MFEYFEKLRRLPDPERKRKVLLLSGYITLAIALVWAVTVFFRVSATDFTFNNQFPGKAATPSLGETLSNFGSRIKEIWSRDLPPDVVEMMGTTTSSTTEEVGESSDAQSYGM